MSTSSISQTTKLDLPKQGGRKFPEPKQLEHLLRCFLQVLANWSPMELEGDHCSCQPLLLASLQRQHHCHTQHLYRRFLSLLVVHLGAHRPTDESVRRWRRRALSFASATGERLGPPIGSAARSACQRTTASALAAGGVQRWPESVEDWVGKLKEKGVGKRRSRDDKK